MVTVGADAPADAINFTAIMPLGGMVRRVNAHPRRSHRKRLSQVSRWVSS